MEIDLYCSHICLIQYLSVFKTSSFFFLSSENVGICRLTWFSFKSCFYHKLQRNRCSYLNPNVYIITHLWVIEKAGRKLHVKGDFHFLLFAVFLTLCQLTKSWHKKIKNITHVCWHIYFKLLIKFSMKKPAVIVYSNNWQKCISIT